MTSAFDSRGRADIVAVIVTYGDGTRLAHTRRAVLRAAEECQHVVLICNGVSGEYSSRLRDMLPAVEEGDVAFYVTGRNLGSAGGFGRGIREARRLWPATHFVLLLDDDDVLVRGAVAEALRLSAEVSTDMPAIISMAKTREGESAPPAAPVLPRSTFLNFDLVKALARRIGRGLSSERHSADVNSGMQPANFAPYAGLLLPAPAADFVVQRAAPDYVLYEDDIEMTFALFRAGFPLWYSPTTVFTDVTDLWLADVTGARSSRLARLIDNPPSFRSYYYIRNRSHFESHGWKSSAVRYQVNRAVALAFLFLYSARRNRLRQFKFVTLAIREGRAGKLGCSPKYPLPN